MARVESFLGLMESIGSITTPSNRRDWLIETFLAFARGFSFREKAQRYHNPLLSNVRRRKSARARPSNATKCVRASRWKGWRQYVKRRGEPKGSCSAPGRRFAIRGRPAG